MKSLKILILLTFSSVSILQAQDSFIPKAFISISTTAGSHSIKFVDFDQSAGLSFGFDLNVGIFAVQKTKFQGGFQFALLEGASYEENRRQISEDFVLPNTDFDKHIIFKFAQFRSATVGWFSRLQLKDNIALEHQLGFGIFGTTEKDQLYDFGMRNSLGVILGKPERINFKLGLIHDAQIGIGNPNYTMSNIGILIGAVRSF